MLRGKLLALKEAEDEARYSPSGNYGSAWRRSDYGSYSKRR